MTWWGELGQFVLDTLISEPRGLEGKDGVKVEETLFCNGHLLSSIVFFSLCCDVLLLRPDSEVQPATLCRWNPRTSFQPKVAKHLLQLWDYDALRYTASTEGKRLVI